MDRRRRGGAQGPDAGRVRGEDGRDLARRDWPSGARTPARIARFRDAVDVAIYTPGSNAGLPLTVLRSLRRAAAGRARRRRTPCASASWPRRPGLLALLGIDADPLQSREHILLSTHPRPRLARGPRPRPRRPDPRDPDRRRSTSVGVFDLEIVLSRRRTASSLAMQLNNLLASPGFAGWMEGEPLDIQRLLYTPEGKPRLSILSIAHLSDAERMFFVTILLNEVLAWMRDAARHVQPAGAALHGRGVRLLPADRQPAVQDAHAHAAQAGPGLRAGRACWPRRTRSTSTTRACPTRAPGSSAGCRPSGTRPACWKGWKAPPPRRARASTARQMEATLAGLGQPRVPDEQRARGRPGRVPHPLGAVLPAGPAHARPDRHPHGGPEGCRGSSAEDRHREGQECRGERFARYCRRRSRRRS